MTHDAKQYVIATPEWFVAKVEEAKIAGSMIHEIAVITPEFARWLLERYNTHNRKLVGKHVAKWKKILKEGRYMLLSQGIFFAGDGVMNNGQHRVIGVRDTGVSVPIVMCFGENKLAFKSLDTGGTRTGAQALSLSDIKNATIIAAAARLAMNIRDHGPGTTHGIDNDALLDFVGKNPAIIEAAAAYRTIKGDVVNTTAAIVCLFFFILSGSKHKEKFSEFVRLLKTGDGLAMKTPVWTYREGFAKRAWEAGDKKHSQGTNAYMIGAGIKCWNRWVKDPNCSLRVDSLSWSMDDDFPTVL